MQSIASSRRCCCRIHCRSAVGTGCFSRYRPLVIRLGSFVLRTSSACKAPAKPFSKSCTVSGSSCWMRLSRTKNSQFNCQDHGSAPEARPRNWPLEEPQLGNASLTATSSIFDSNRSHKTKNPYHHGSNCFYNDSRYSDKLLLSTTTNFLKTNRIFR